MGWLRTAAAVAAIGLLASTAAAQSHQSPGLELAAGFGRLQNLQTDRDFPVGLFLSIEGNYHSHIEPVGEFSGTLFRRRPRFFGDPSAGTAAFLAGPKVTRRAIPHVVAFGQLLVGGVDSGDSNRGGYPAIGIQPGAGVDIHLREHVGVRLAADRRQMLGILAASGASTSVAMFRVGLICF